MRYQLGWLLMIWCEIRSEFVARQLAKPLRGETKASPFCWPCSAYCRNKKNATIVYIFLAILTEDPGGIKQWPCSTKGCNAFAPFCKVYWFWSHFAGTPSIIRYNKYLYSIYKSHFMRKLEQLEANPTLWMTTRRLLISPHSHWELHFQSQTPECPYRASVCTPIQMHLFEVWHPQGIWSPNTSLGPATCSRQGPVEDQSVYHCSQQSWWI